MVDGTALVAVLDRTSTLEAIREKVEAGERLDLEDGLALMESDDLLALGELADLARRAARRRRRGLLRPEPLPEPDERLPREVQVLRVRRRRRSRSGAYTYTAEELVEDALRQRELTGFTEIHMVSGESPHVDFDYYVDIDRAAARGAAGRAPEAVTRPPRSTT